MGRRKSSSKKNQGAQKTSSSHSGAPTAEPTPRHQEDAALWERVTKSLTPLKTNHDRLHFGPLLDEQPATPPRQNFAGAGPSAPANAAPGSGASGGKRLMEELLNDRQASKPVTPLPQHNSFSRREMRQINNGHQQIEARLDLHGLRQDGAHIALRGFLINAQARGFRHVLVITGKGRSNLSDELIFGEPEAGVLRRAVPMWLGEPDLAAIVAGFSDAPPRHGGEGALYVRLRRNR